MADSGVAREDLFVTTKLWNSIRATTRRCGRSTTASPDSASTTSTYLIHWPAPAQDRYVDTFKAFQQLKADGRIRSIGVSNFTAENLERLVEAVGRPRCSTRSSCIRTSRRRTCVPCTPTWASSPRRGVHSGRAPRSRTDDPRDRRRARAHAAQVILRWHIQLGTW
ncbi:hypothetical protein GS943_11875 [Rhodococcus hoagii]|nr:hypothetical protein [Prescottella equi]